MQRMWSSFREACTIGSTRTLKSLDPSRRSASGGTNDTQDMSPPHGRWPVGSSSNRLSPHVEVEVSSSWRAEEVVSECGIKPGMEHTIFESEEHGFRLQVQGDSVPACSPGEQQDSGPITVAPLRETIGFEGGQLEGVLEVHCLPTGRRFDAPLLFDFLVEAGGKDDPIMDQHGRIRYEVLTKNGDSDGWGRDPESSIPLEIVKDDQGNIYVRAQVRHFCFWGFFKNKLDFGPQLYHMQTIPWSQRRRHQSIIKNDTPGMDIHVYVMRMSQWAAALESVKAGAGQEGFEANFEMAGDLREEVNPAALIPQMVTIPPEHSHWFEIPRVGSGFRSSRRAVVVIVTESIDERDGRKMRMESVEHLRCGTMLTVKLRVENGSVVGNPCAAESGGILSQVNRVIQNQVNATPGRPPAAASSNTEARSRSETNSLVDETGSAVSSASTACGAISGARPSGATLMDSPATTDSDRDASSPGAAEDKADAARLADGEKLSNTSSVAPAARGTPAAVLARDESGASVGPPPAELPALPSPHE